jgi:Concanavalin A-like lectin/glucanases superfamily
MAITFGAGITLGPGISVIPSYDLVTAGMLLNFDAATYSGTGNWIDSWAGVNAVPTNSPTWSSDNGGTFVLSTPSVQYFTVPWPTFQPTFTIDIWFNFTASQTADAPCLISDDFSGPFNFTINAAGNYLQTGWYTTNWQGQYATNNVPTAFTHDGTTWYNITMAVGATEYKDYINGVVSYAPGNFGGGSAPNGSGALQQFYIGKRWDNADTVNAKMAVVNIYDRALSDAEVAQNFNHYRSRFSL